MKRLYLLGALALLLAACGPSASPTVPAGTAASAPAPVAEGLATAVPATAAPVAATGVPAASPPPASGVAPVVDPYNGFLLGGARNGEWLSAESIAPLLTGDEIYRLYSPNAAVAELSGSTPELVGVPCQDVRKVVLSGGDRTSLVAVAGTWDALPRVPEDLPADSPAYVEAVTQLLSEAGLANPTVQITRILRSDLNGDFQDFP